jgi:neopullulanase
MRRIFLSSVLVLLTLVLTAANLKRVEPMFWWAGMKNPQLQLLVYGEEIGTTRVLVEYPGVTLKSVSQVENPNYLFVDLHIEGAQPGQFPIRFVKNGETVAEYSYELKARKPGSAERKGFGPADALYLIMPDRFANGNPDNDFVEGMKEKPNRSNKGGRHGGDIQGLVDNLDYIANMGFTAIWLNPLLENDQPSYSYHGYSTTDFFKVDARYGTNEEYRDFALKASEKGIKLIMDMIFNHCGSEHWWMKDLPSSDWINQYPDYQITNHTKTLIQDPNGSEYDRNQMLDGWFVPTMPDLNQRNPFMATYLIQNSIWWIEYAMLSGIRMDTYPYPDKHMMAEWNLRVLEEYPYFNNVGEEWHNNAAIVSYWQKGKKNLDGYDGQIPSMMDFPLQDAVSRALRQEGAGGLNIIYDALAMDFQYPDPLNLVIFPDNHDMSRFYMQVNQDFDLFRMGIAYFLTTRGIPQIFYGTEVLLTHPGDNHGDIRKDFPGGWKGDKVNGFTGEGLTPKEKDAQEFIRKMLNWRKEKEVIHSGKTTHFLPYDGMYVYFRHNQNDMVMVVLNKNSGETTFKTTRLTEMLKGKTSATEVISGKKISNLSEIKLPGRSVSVFEIK